MSQIDGMTDTQLWEIWQQTGLADMWRGVLRKSVEAGEDTSVAQDAIESVEHQDPLSGLRAGDVLAKRIVGQRWILIRAAREQGASWQQVGDALGISRQAAHQSYVVTIELQKEHLGQQHDTVRSEAVRTPPSERTRGMGATLHRVKVEVDEVTPVIWRRFDIDSEASLNDLHMAIQIGFGWENFHLHHFQVGYDRYSSNSNFSSDSQDSRSVTLGSLTTAGDMFGYVYDYGDNWGLTLTIEKVVAKRGDPPFVRCTHGRRAGPPEDIGGPWGYHELVAAMKTGRGSNYNHWRQINGYKFDPVAFNVEETNQDLAHWAKKHDQE